MINVITNFVRTAGIVLFITGPAKILSSIGTARILWYHDPLVGIQFRYLMLLVGTIELAIASLCLYTNHLKRNVELIAWIATNFLIYRMGLWAIGWHRPCECLGNLTGMLHIPSETADIAMKIILAYLLIGSYAILFWLWRQQRKVEGKMQNDEVKSAAAHPEMRPGS